MPQLRSIIKEEVTNKNIVKMSRFNDDVLGSSDDEM